MSDIEIIFSYNGFDTIIQCDNDKKFKDIYLNFRNKAKAEKKQLYFMYNGTSITNDESTFDEIANYEDKKRNKMNILVNELEFKDDIKNKQSDIIIKSKNIICPKCNENIKFNIDNYNINLFECKNKHNIDLFLDEFDASQNINISKIICQNCKNYNKGNVHDNVFYRCNSCKINLCPICFSNHDKKHNLINYDDKNYICEEHNKIYISYCEECRENLCLFCEPNHKGHNIIHFGEFIPDKNHINNKLKQLKEKIDVLKNDVNDIITKLNKFMKNLDVYYSINENIINNYNQDKINCEILNNINNINKEDIIKDINEITEDKNIITKFEKMMHIYNNMISPNNILITYNVPKRQFYVNIFGEDFVKNNKKNCKMIIEGNAYALSEKFDLENYNEDKLTINLKGIKNITNISYMFNNCKTLISLSDISKMDTSKVINMSYLFSYCYSLNSLPDISEWNTLNVKDMSYMFTNCKALKSLPDLSKWNTSNVNNMKAMFSGCKSLISLPDISNWDISNVNNISEMFSYCESLISLPDISKWNTSQLKENKGMYDGCDKIKNKQIIKPKKWKFFG